MIDFISTPLDRYAPERHRSPLGREYLVRLDRRVISLLKFYLRLCFPWWSYLAECHIFDPFFISCHRRSLDTYFFSARLRRVRRRVREGRQLQLPRLRQHHGAPAHRDGHALQLGGGDDAPPRRRVSRRRA